MKIASKTALASSTILLLFLLITDPQRLPSVLLVVPFLLLFTSLASSVPLLLAACQFSGRKAIKTGVVIATVPVLLLVMQSLGQLTARDVLAVLVLFGFVYFYVSRFGLRFAG